MTRKTMSASDYLVAIGSSMSEMAEAQELVEAGYLKVIPKDPITDSTETWQLVNEDTTMSVDQTQPGVSDVKSGAQGTSSEGTPYSEW